MHSQVHYKNSPAFLQLKIFNLPINQLFESLKRQNYSSYFLFLIINICIPLCSIYIYIYIKEKLKKKKREKEKRIVEQIPREFTLEQFPSSRIYTQLPQGIRGFPVLNHFSTRSITRDKCFARGNSTNNVDTWYRHRRIIEPSFFLRSVADFPFFSRKREG